MKNILITVLLLVTVSAFGQVPTPAKDQILPIALMNGVVHVGDGSVIENGIITFEEGKITSVGDARTVKVDLTNYEVINVSGKHVYPGFITTNSSLGLNDISAVRATRDDVEVGEFTPNVRSLIAYNTDSEIIPTLRYNGILLAQVVPKGGVISGSSSIMALDGWNWEDATYAADDGIHLFWPSFLSPPKWWLGETEWKENESYKSTVQRIENFLNDAKMYSGSADPKTENLKLKAMEPVLSGEKKFYVHADGKREMIEGINLLLRFEIKNIVVVGAKDAFYIMDFLKDHNVPVLLKDIHRLPGRDEEDIDLPFKLPYYLNEKGIMVGLTFGGSLQSTRNLPFYAGTAAAYGLDKEEALKMITSNTAEILGIQESTGTLTEGKDANIIVSEGDALDMRTNNILYAFINGKKLNLEGRQQILFERYKERYSDQ